MDKIAEKESFFNLLNSVIAFAVHNKSNLLNVLHKMRHDAYYDLNFSFEEASAQLAKINDEILCKNI